MEFMSVEKHGGVAVITWRHEEQNRFTGPFLAEFLAALDELENDGGVRGVVLTSGLGKFFSNGLHLEWMMEQGAKDFEILVDFLRKVNETLIRATSFQKPFVGAINGHATGAGAILAACLDFRFMREDRGFIRFPEMQINIPFWPGMTAVVKDILPPASVRDMFYTGDRYTSGQARDLGFIDEVCPPDELLQFAVDKAEKLGTAHHETYGAIKNGLRADVLQIMRTQDQKAIEKTLAGMKKAAG